MLPGLSNYLYQFEPWDRPRAEAVLFATASKYVKDYTGGMWQEEQVGNVWLPVLPQSGTKDNLYRVIVPTNWADEMADPESIGAALAIYAVTAIQNHHFSANHGRLSEKYADLYDSFREAIFAKDSGLNHTAIYRIID